MALAMKILYLDRQKMFSVEQDEEGNLFLCVVVGGIAMREIRVPMSQDMVDLFRSNPESLIDKVKEIGHFS